MRMEDLLLACATWFLLDAAAIEEVNIVNRTKKAEERKRMISRVTRTVELRDLSRSLQAPGFQTVIRELGAIVASHMDA